MEDQEKQSQTWWQKNKRLLIIATVIILILLLTFALAIHWFGWDWTGFTSATEPTLKPNEQYRPAKTLWDVLQLLIVPIILVIGGFWLNQIQKSREEKITKQRAETEQKIAQDNQQEVALQEYIDKMSELLLKEGLRESQLEDEVRRIARVQTLTVLTRLGPKRKRSVLQFLYEAGLINKDKQLVELHGADLTEIDLNYAKLRGADLRGAILMRARLGAADLSETDLRETNLWGADLAMVVQEEERDISFLHGQKIVLLQSSDEAEAKLSNANLSGASLYGTSVNPGQLEKAKSLKGAIMPDGSIHP